MPRTGDSLIVSRGKFGRAAKLRPRRSCGNPVVRLSRLCRFALSNRERPGRLGRRGGDSIAQRRVLVAPPTGFPRCYSCEVRVQLAYGSGQADIVSERLLNFAAGMQDRAVIAAAEIRADLLQR